MIAPLLFGTSVAVFGYWVMSLIRLERDDSQRTTVESVRRQRLRRQSLAYRLFEPLIDSLVLTGIAGLPDQEIMHADCPWRPPEFFVGSIVVGGFCGLIPGLFGLLIAVVWSFALFIAGFLAGFFLFRVLVTDKIKSQRAELIRRLPYVIDLMALVTEAGGSLSSSLKTAARENQDNILGSELNSVVREIQLGKTEADALSEFADKYDEENIRYFVSSIVQGQKLGVPIEKTLRTQASEMIQRRSQWIEKASGEAKVKITGPGFVIALACMGIMAAPFLMQVIFSIM